MKILAVIPARAGSKGIPNKNVRIVCDKPLIAYSIENAIKSKMISDIIITSDSSEIELIAKYYNVKFLRREGKLCKDDVTLDAVIYNAVKDNKADYIVTMQPTSPTLKTETLDKAIKYAIENDLDTLISVCNKPSLAWKEIDGNVVPEYSQRLNRQYLPKRYVENGAFLISKISSVTEKTRIGKKVGVYEISDNESIDIDNFEDLACVETILKQKKIAIIVNGNSTIGMGHISRMMELADQAYCKPVFYFNSCITKKENFGITTYQLESYLNEDQLIQELAADKYNIIINDILDTKVEYMKKLKNLSCKIVNFEDAGEGRNYADIVVNALYHEKSVNRKIYCGEDYYFAPKLFMLYKPITIRKKINRAFICFGGADPKNYTEKVLKIISDRRNTNCEYTVVLGRMKANYCEIMEKYKNIEMYYDVKNMPELMSKCDIAITSMGRTCFELAMLGIPTFAVAQNEREERHTFVCNDNGFVNLSVNSTDNELLDGVIKFLGLSYEQRKNMQMKMLSHDLKKGRERIKNLLNSL